MTEVAHWLSRAIAEVEGCGAPEAELLLQQGVMSLKDLSRASLELLTSFPGIDEEGAGRIKVRAEELIEVKVEEEEQQRLEAEAEAAAAVVAAAEAAAAAAAPEEASEEAEPDEQVADDEEANAGDQVTADEQETADEEAG